MCFDHRGIIPLWFDQIVVFVKSQNHINFCYYLALVVRQLVIQVSPFNLHRNILVEMLTVSTYNNLSFSTNCHFLFFLLFFLMSFKSCIRRKSQSFPKSLKKYTSSELGVELSTFVLCERRWSWYRMTHCQVKDTGRVLNITMWNTLVVLPYDALSCCTGCGTVWHIARWKALVVVPYDTLPGERH
jgi:hypothetical protein